jgi:hypothetical protein
MVDKQKKIISYQKYMNTTFSRGITVFLSIVIMFSLVLPGFAQAITVVTESVIEEATTVVSEDATENDNTAGDAEDVVETDETPVVVTSTVVVSGGLPQGCDARADLNYDGHVNGADLAIMDAAFKVGSADLGHGDFNSNGVVDFDDYSVMDQSINNCDGHTIPVPQGCNYADLNHDGFFNQADYAIMDAAFTAGTASPETGDFDGNGVIDFDDYSRMDYAHNTCHDFGFDMNHVIGTACEKADLNDDGVVNVTDSKIQDSGFKNDLTGIGNGDLDQNGIIDFDDFALMDFARNTCGQTNPNPAPNPTGNGGGGNGGGSSGGGGTGFVSGAGATPGRVLGATTGPACDTYLANYIKLGAKNDITDVVKLQMFLNSEMAAKLLYTGIYNIETMNIVNAFQVKYGADVLKPWVAFGLPNETTPTGYVYKTTKAKINSIACNKPLEAVQLP